MLDKARLLILGLMGNTIVCRVSAESLGDRDSRARETLRGTGGGEGTGGGRRATGEDPESREATNAAWSIPSQKPPGVPASFHLVSVAGQIQAQAEPDFDPLLLLKTCTSSN